VFFVADTLGTNWKVVIQKEPRSLRIVDEIEELNLGRSDLEGVQIDLATVARVDRMGGDEIDHVQVEHAMVEAAQAEAVYNSDDDLLETHHMNYDS
jgi:hypothetical protein